MTQVFTERVMFLQSLHAVRCSFCENKLIVVILCPRVIFPNVYIGVILKFAHLALHTDNRNIYTLVSSLSFFVRLYKAYGLQQGIELCVTRVVIESGYLRKWRYNKIIGWQALDVSLKQGGKLRIGNQLIVLLVLHPFFYALHVHAMILADLYEVTEVTETLKQHEAYRIAVAKTTLRTRPMLVNLYLVIKVFQ